jgi:HlyD family secretion protein
MTRSHWLGMVLSGTALVGVTAWAFHSTPEVQVESARVTAGPITRRVVATGTVQAVTTVDVGTQVSGLVQSLDVDFNSVVHAGQVLAQLDPSLYQSALDQARGGLRQAEAALNQAQADLTGSRTAEEDARTMLGRARELAASQLITAADLDAAQIAVDEASANVRSGAARVNEARAGIDQARASVDQAKINLDHTIIHSPIDGIVIDRQVDVGQTMAAAMQAPVLFRIASNLTHVQVQADIDESDVGGQTQGETATFEVESYPDETFHGVVTQLRLQPVAEQTTTTTTTTTVATSTASPTSSVVATVVSYTAIIDVANPDVRLRPGMTAVVAFAGLWRESAVRIPNSALAFRPPPEVLRALGEPEPSASDAASVTNDSNTRSRDVWEYDGKRLTPIAVHIGLTNDQWTELLSGSIRPGDTLVTSAVLRQRSRL